ncbi:hypothetical protein PUN28_014097 [Cardiocondyla obscurior]|uniref:Uncharacterized protein n=1 Tax=Cardiocondyla obscurior TaxID=286306 RepID=A0AAW2EYC4_9HYME
MCMRCDTTLLVRSPFPHKRIVKRISYLIFNFEIFHCHYCRSLSNVRSSCIIIHILLYLLHYVKLLINPCEPTRRREVSLHENCNNVLILFIARIVTCRFSQILHPVHCF